MQGLFGKISGQPESYYKKKNYTFGRVLGAGTFGVVRLAKNSQTGEQVAAKIILKKKLHGNEDIVTHEIGLLQKLHHPNIVEFKDWFESKEKFYIITQLATGGELFDRICERGHFREKDAVQCVKQILEAVNYLHSSGIVHRDIKPENLIYVTSEPDSPLVLADFGIAKALSSPDEKLTASAGSFGYAAPEVLQVKSGGHGFPCDIWSLGVVAYTVLCGYSPFRAETVPDFLKEVGEGYQVVFHEKYWKGISNDARLFISKALAIDPSKRPTAKEMLEDKWITGVTDYGHSDLLPGIRQGFNARQKFRFAIEAIRLKMRIKQLEMPESEDDGEYDDFDFGFETSNTGSSGTSDSHSSRHSTRFAEVVIAAARQKDLVRGSTSEEKVSGSDEQTQ